MASAISCDMCNQETAQVMQTNIANGDVLAVGPNCQLVFYLTVAQTMMDEMPAENIAAYGDVLSDVVDRLTAHLGRDAHYDTLEADDGPMTGDMVPMALDIEPTDA